MRNRAIALLLAAAMMVYLGTHIALAFQGFAR